MKYILSFGFLLLFGKFASSQYAQIQIKINYPSDHINYRFCLVQQTDSIYCKNASYSERFDVDTLIDSLSPGLYSIFIFNKGSEDKTFVQRDYHLKADELTVANLSVYFLTTVSVINPETKDDFYSEGQLSYGYFRDAWINQENAISSNVSFSMTFFNNVPISKHLSWLFGIGLGYSQHNFYKDSSFINIGEYQKKKERYSDFAYIFDMKLRLFSGVNSVKKKNGQRITLDLGASYNFPLMFRHTRIYNTHIKLTENQIHQFTDFRTYINLGYYPFSVFAEYRPFNFVSGNLPEISRYNFGIKFFIPEH